MQEEILLRIPEGININHKILYSSQEAVRKTLKKPTKKVRFHMYKYFHMNRPGMRYRKAHAKTPEQEAQILVEWKRAKIPAPKVLKYTANQLITEYIPSQPFSQVVAKYDSQAMNALLDTWNKITRLARKKQDKNCLHTDPNLNNFLWDCKRAYAIDPGPEIRQEYSLEETLAETRIYFMQHIHRTSSHAKNYLQQFSDSLSKEEREKIKQLHISNTPTLRAAFSVIDYVHRKINELEKLDVKKSTNWRKSLTEHEYLISFLK